MISVAEALERVLAAFSSLAAETIPLTEGSGRVLAEPLVARVTQPPMAVSAMDGYAVRAADLESLPARLRVVGEVAAGGLAARSIGAGECFRIFTGASLPPGADTIVIQEDVERDGDAVAIAEAVRIGTYVRPAGLDFTAGETLIPAGRQMTARDIGLAAGMNIPWLRVRRRPRIAILATGDELAMPGEEVAPGQIIASSSLALAALISAAGGAPSLLGIARDSRTSLREMAAAAEGADLLLTTGGASVGDHDLIRAVLGEASLDFWRIAMRPGKPMLFGHIGHTPVLGLPGNPVSTQICAMLFALPALRKMQGLEATPLTPERARLGRDLGANDRRQDYLRSRLEPDEDGLPVATPFERQDSSMLRLLADADCLVVRPPHAPPAAAGDPVEIVRFPAGA